MSLDDDSSSPSTNRRLQLVTNYLTSIGTPTDHLDPTKLEAEFNAQLLSLKYPELDANETLLEVALRYSLTYLEEYDYTLKLFGLKLLTRVVAETTPTRLKYNMRLELIGDTLSRFVNDKECVEFLDACNELMLKLMGLVESTSNTNEHYFKKSSILVDAMLNNCYMSTNVAVKCVYLKHLKTALVQVGPFACRHLEKFLTVLFDSIELGKLNSDFKTRESSNLIVSSIDLMCSLVDTCLYRIHSHSKRIIQFFLKLIYFYSQTVDLKDLITVINETSSTDESSTPTTPCSPSFISTSSPSDPNNNINNEPLGDYRLAVCLKSVRLIQLLFRNDRIRRLLYDDFKIVKTDSHLNKSFLKLIENI